MDLPEKILALLAEVKLIDSLQLAGKFNEDHQKIVGAVKSLEGLPGVVKSEPKSLKKFELTNEGEEVSQRGSHEAVVFGSIPAEGGIAQTDLMKLLATSLGPAAKVGFSKAMSLGWLAIDKTGGAPKIVRKVSGIEDEVQKQLVMISQGQEDAVPDKAREDFRKRKLLQEVLVKYYELTPGDNFTTTIQKPETELTPEMIANGSWKTANFKAYNFDALGIQPQRGNLHPLLKVRAEYRQIFLEMGFSEMPTNNYIESSFWNFDALFQPQQHPARDAHDTFFISDPAEASGFPADYLEKVKKVHSSGGYGSQGYGYDWKIEEAKKNLLRTHTTAVSARMLYKLSQECLKTGTFEAQKYFSIDRVFRNETLDATHLAEFHQIEGLVADRDLTLGDLLGVISEFFKKLNIKKLRFKPAYNPYTEPSMEIFSYHEGLKKWVEIGNSGIFRPEMLLPMGLPEDVNVIAWGLSLERPTMIKYGIDNIRDLVGHKVNLKMVQENPLCRLDKNDVDPTAALARVTEKRWIRIEAELEHLKSRVANILVQKGIKPVTAPATIPVTLPTSKKATARDLVIWADPEFPPYSIPTLCSALARLQSVSTSTHTHSNVTKPVPDHLKNFFPESEFQECLGSKPDWKVTVIWKKVGQDPVLILSPFINQVVLGESNIVRYLARCLEETSSKACYENLPTAVTCKIDQWLDVLHVATHGGAESIVQEIVSQLKGKSSLVPECGGTSLPDLVLASICKQGSTLVAKRKEIKDWNKSPKLYKH